MYAIRQYFWTWERVAFVCAACSATSAVIVLHLAS